MLVGLNTGSLRIYRVNETDDEEESEQNGDHESVANGSESAKNDDAAPKIKPADLLREEEKFSRRLIMDGIPVLGSFTILLVTAKVVAPFVFSSFS